MSFDYSYVLPPSGPANNAEVREMFEDVKAYVNTLISGGGSGAPNTSQYVTLATDSNLTSERVLTAGAGIGLTDNGAGSTIVVANTGVRSITISDPYSNLTASASTGAITLSETVTPTYSSIILQSASGSIGITPSASVFTSYNLTLPLNTGTSGYILSTNGATPTATLSWVDPGTNFVTSVHGTPDQINVSGTTGSVTFSTPQDIATTSSPAFTELLLSGGTNISDLTIKLHDSHTGFYADGIGSLYVVVGNGSNVLVGTWDSSTKAYTSSGPLIAEKHVFSSSGNTVTIQPTGAFTSYTLTLPANDGSANQYLTTDGSGVLSWTNAAGTGTVNTGNAKTLAYYDTATNAVFALSAITNGRALISDANGLPTHSVTTSGELAFVSGVTSAIQTQIDSKAGTGLAFVTIGNTGSLSAERALTGTANQVVITDNGANSTVVLSTPQNIHSAATPTFASLSLTATTNQLVLGTTRTATLTAPTPATSSRVYTFPDLTGDYSVLATIGDQTATGVKTFSGQLIGKGTATNDSAASGYIGEYIESVVGATNAAGSGVWKDITSITLTAGDWDVTLNAWEDDAGATWSVSEAGISTSSGTSFSDRSVGSNSQLFSVANTALTVAAVAITVANYRVSISTSTTYYFKQNWTYTLGTPQTRGRISARRFR